MGKIFFASFSFKSGKTISHTRDLCGVWLILFKTVLVLVLIIVNPKCYYGKVYSDTYYL